MQRATLVDSQGEDKTGMYTFTIVSLHHPKEKKINSIENFLFMKDFDVLSI